MSISGPLAFIKVAGGHRKVVLGQDRSALFALPDLSATVRQTRSQMLQVRTKLVLIGHVV